jgi:tRNA-specific 2-thiouridylase
MKKKMNSLGIKKDPKNTRVVVAMSGGVDSSVTAALLHEAGYDVIGITLQLFNYGNAIARPGTCCAGQDIYDAKRVADSKGFPHYVLDYEDRFREDVMEDFADTYLAGETPIPCVRCNQTVKFRDLISRAKELEADVLATGHYVQYVSGTKKSELHRGANQLKDQSYFLFATTQEQLDFLRFPLGGMTKEETREEAERLGLSVADKPDSQDICFVPNGNYADVIKKMRPDAVSPGKIVDQAGIVLGDHEGIINFTIGQRRGLNIGGGDPLYVLMLDPNTKTVVVGPKEALLKKSIVLNGINWLGDEPLRDDVIEITVKIRSMTPLLPATLRSIGEGRGEVTLHTPYAGIAPGQACVFYHDERMLGGGWIVRPN